MAGGVSAASRIGGEDSATARQDTISAKDLDDARAIIDRLATSTDG